MSVFKTTFSRALAVIPSDNANIPFPATVCTGESTGTITNGSTLTSGSLAIGVTYEITNYEVGDDFRNVGANNNANGVRFTATGASPTDWTNGSTLTVIGNYLIDSSAKFVTKRVAPGDIIYNTTDSLAAVVLEVNSQTILSLNADIFDSGTEQYIVYQASPQTGLGNTGCYLYIGNAPSEGSGAVTVTTIGGDIVTFNGIFRGTILPIQVIKLHLTGIIDVDRIIALW